MDRCQSEAPSLEPVAEGHLASCWLAADLGRVAPAAAAVSC
jgi:hypothetical protein